MIHSVGARGRRAMMLGAAGFTVAGSLSAGPAEAATVVIDPGAYVDQYSVAGSYRKGVQTLDLAAGPYTVSPGGYNSFTFSVAADGSVSVPPSSQAEASAAGNTLTFRTVPITVDPGLFADRWRLHGEAAPRLGLQTIHLVPQGRYFFGANYNGFFVDLDADGNPVIANESIGRATASGSTLTFITVPVQIDTNGYLEQWILDAGIQWRVGPRTVHLMPGGLQRLALGETNSLLFGLDLDGVPYVPASPAGNADKLTVSSDGVILTTHPITIDVADFIDQWAIAYGAPGPTGNAIRPLVPGRYRLALAGYNSLYFVVEADGTVRVEANDADKASASGATLTFSTVAVDIDPGLYEGEWTFHYAPFWRRYGSEENLVPGRYRMQVGAYNGIFMTVQADGAVIVDPADLALGKALGHATGIELLTQPIRFDPSPYGGNWSIARGGTFVGGGVVELVPGPWGFASQGAGAQLFDVLAPCGTSVSSRTDSRGVTFQLACEVDLDLDEDGVVDDEDNCADVANPEQLDTDLDGVGDACDDDADGDDVVDTADNCVGLFNPAQDDGDGDGDGDACDDDDDGDLISDDVDNCLALANPDQADADLDGTGDACDEDDDDDLIPDGQDNCPLLANGDQADLDADGQGDACDGDDDGDLVPDESDRCMGTSPSLAITADGCSADQYVALACIASTFRNHGKYVSCVAHAANELLVEGVIDEAERGRIVALAAKSK